MKSNSTALGGLWCNEWRRKVEVLRELDREPNFRVIE